MTKRDQENSEPRLETAAEREVGLPQDMVASLIESANDAIITKTLEGTITSWNKAAERIFGYAADEIIGRSILTLIPEERRHEETIIIGRIKAGERLEHYETIRRRKDGELIEISITVSPIRDAEGTIIGASKIAREVTEINRTTRQLQASREQYRTLFNAIDEAFCVIRVIFDETGQPVDYLFLEVNPAFEKHTGLVQAEGKTILELEPEIEKHWFEIYGNVVRTGEPVRREEVSPSLSRWFDLYAFRIGDPSEAKVAILFHDISQRVKAEEERRNLLAQLESERSKLAYLFEKAPAFVATLSGPEHVFELANPAYFSLVGHREVVGRKVRDVFPDLEGQGYFELLDNVYKTGEAFIGRELPVELAVNDVPAADSRFLDLLYQPMFDSEGAVSGIFVHGVDISDLVRARKDAEAANRAKDEFLATLSHELRTPLNAILGWSELMMTNELDEEMRVKAQETIRRNAKAQVQLIDDILDVSRIISGKLKLEVRPVELSAVVEAAAEAVLPAAEARGIRLQRVLDYGSCLVSGDPDRLQQVIWNLLSNAIKFTPKGGRVQLRLERINSHVEIIVTDNGMGIPPQLLPHVFERFRQADSSTTRQHGGLGLGLAIVRHLVEMHGGTVEAESLGEGHGSTFTVKLPQLAVRSADVRRGSSSRQHPTERRDAKIECPPELEGLKVLAVDDEEDSRTLLRMVLQKCGAEVIAVDSVKAAMDAIRKQRPDVLISDIGMPEEDGYALIKKLRALPADQGGRTPAAALTAFARLEDRMRVLRAGFQIHLPKPVEPAELIAVVASLAGRSEG